MDMNTQGQSMPSVDSSSMGKGMASEMGDDSQNMVTLTLPKTTIDALKMVIKDLGVALDQVSSGSNDTPQEQMDDSQMSDSDKLQQEIAQMSQGGAR